MSPAQNREMATDSHGLDTARRPRNRGFTLIEVMVVVVILGILAAVVVPRLVGRTDDAKVQAARIGINALTTALELYKLDNGAYPTTDQGLEALIRRTNVPPEPPKWREGGYLKGGSKNLRDPWSHPYYYLSPGQQNRTSFDLASLGEDGLVGGEFYAADITNWDAEER